MRSPTLRRLLAALTATALWATLAPTNGPAVAAADDGWSPATSIATERDRRHLSFPGFAVNGSGAAVVAWRCARPAGLALCARMRTTDGAWGSATTVARPDELAGRRAPRAVLDEAGMATLVWVQPDGQAVARRVLPDGSTGETHAIASGLPRGSAAAVFAPAADGSLLVAWWRPDTDEADGAPGSIRVLAPDGALSPVHDLPGDLLGQTVTTPTGWALLSLDGSRRYRLTRVTLDGAASESLRVGAAGRGRLVGFGTAALTLGPDGEPMVAWLRPDQGELRVRAFPATGAPGPVTTVAEGLDRPRWLSLGRTASGRLLATYAEPSDKGRETLFGLRLPTADDEGSAPARLGRLPLPLAVVTGEATRFVGWRGHGSTVAVWTWDGEGELSAPRELMASPFPARRETAYGVGYSAAGSTLGVLGYWTREGKHGQRVTRIAVTVWGDPDAAADQPLTAESGSRVVVPAPFR